jgi:hypothetical protein
MDDFELDGCRIDGVGGLLFGRDAVGATGVVRRWQRFFT